MVSTPEVSVIMPVYNGEAFVAEAMQSILNQTYTDFELLIIDDGSTDNSLQVARSFQDPRIRVVVLEKNIGLAHVRNRGIEEARGTFIAWIDCDDINLPTRLAQQVTLMRAKPGIGLCGGWSRVFGSQENQELRFPSSPDELRTALLFYNPFATSTLLIRKAFLEEHQLRFDPLFPPAEDYDLWEKISQHSELYNIPEVLSLYRTHAHQSSTRMSENQKKAIWWIQERLLHTLRVFPTPAEQQIHLEIGVNWTYRGTPEALVQTQRWLEKLFAANQLHKAFPEPAFTLALAERWKYTCLLATQNGFNAWKTFHRSPLHRYANLHWLTKLRFGIYSFLKVPWERKVF